MKYLFVFLLMACSTGAFAQQPLLEKAGNHAMRYYLALPKGWNKEREWPVVVALECAEKDFRGNALRFAAARGERPYIIVVPCAVTNGNQGMHDPNVYPYTEAEWKQIDQGGICRFDLEGIRAVIADVRTRYHGAQKVYATGFEAGTHLLWNLVFGSPELLLAAAPVGGNFIERCMDLSGYSNNELRKQLPVRNFTGANDSYFGVDGKIYSQYLRARSLAVAHGYQKLSDQVVPGKGHEPMPEEILDWFDSVQR